MRAMDRNKFVSKEDTGMGMGRAGQYCQSLGKNKSESQSHTLTAREDKEKQKPLHNAEKIQNCVAMQEGCQLLQTMLN